MSSERKYTGMAKLFAIEEKQQKEKAAAKAAENISPPANFSPAEVIFTGLKILQPLKLYPSSP
jgi:hypothetical protein